MSYELDPPCQDNLTYSGSSVLLLDASPFLSGVRPSSQVSVPTFPVGLRSSSCLLHRRPFRSRHRDTVSGTQSHRRKRYSCGRDPRPWYERNKERLEIYGRVMTVCHPRVIYKHLIYFSRSIYNRVNENCCWVTLVLIVVGVKRSLPYLRDPLTLGVGSVRNSFGTSVLNVGPDETGSLGIRVGHTVKRNRRKRSSKK